MNTGVPPVSVEAARLPRPGAVSGLSESSNWREILAPYSHIVLVANSGALDVVDLQPQYPATTLFVFFNRVYKSLDRPFEGHALLVSRAQPKGANIVYRNEVSDVLSYFAQAHFLGILNIRLAASEKLNTSADYQNAPTGHLDLLGYCDSFYTSGKTPTSGFAIALWLSELRLPAKIVLAGFSAKRTAKWRVVSIHDWSFEQTFLRVFARLGKVTIEGGVPKNPYAALAERFPEIPPSDIELAATEVLSERLSHSDGEIDKLISLTNFIRAGDEFLRGLRPSSVKRRIRGSR